MTHPDFFSEQDIVELHADLLRAHGGPAGHKPELVASIAGYPQQKLAYVDPAPTIPALAAYYGFAAARFHAFADGNKRIALALVALFLKDHGFELEAGEDHEYETIIALADGSLDEAAFVAWVERHAVPS